LPFSHRQKKLAPFRFRLSAKTAFCAFLLPLQIKPTLLGFDLISGGYDTSSSQKTKITRKSIAVRCKAVLARQKSGQTTKRPQGILCVLARPLRMYGRSFCPSKPCVSLSTEGKILTGKQNISRLGEGQ
ncbi:MAG: hypothetical protein Q4C32_09080, partial [Eubacteriales bacterium]|nr:hypothetical protein [Eubacteriales bacterium]